MENTLRILGLAGTVDILQHLNTHKKAHYKELIKKRSPPTINSRIFELRKLKLIEHHFLREKTRKEWYTMTEKGKKVFEYIKKLQKYDKENNDGKGIIHVISHAKTALILAYFDAHETVQYSNLVDVVTSHTLNTRLRALEKLNLIEHHFRREIPRKEWYTMTEKGKKVYRIVQKLQNLLEKNQ